jgi:ribosomal protein L37AE/L43A
MSRTEEIEAHAAPKINDREGGRYIGIPREGTPIDETEEPMMEITTRVVCPECQERISEEMAVPLWECSRDDCGEIWASEERDPCEECGSPFSRKLAEVGCPACLEEPDELRGAECGNPACPADGWHEAPEPGAIDTSGPEWNPPGPLTAKQDRALDRRFHAEEARMQAEADRVAVTAAQACQDSQAAPDGVMVARREETR